jgi:hypothetical protein
MTTHSHPHGWLTLLQQTCPWPSSTLPYGCSADDRAREASRDSGRSSVRVVWHHMYAHQRSGKRARERQAGGAIWWGGAPARWSKTSLRNRRGRRCWRAGLHNFLVPYCVSIYETKKTLTPIFLKDIRYKFSDTNLKGSAKVDLIGGATVDV